MVFGDGPLMSCELDVYHAFDIICVFLYLL